ncbi:MAG: TetR family transcriptional regulator C-terminal domain-containing protein [Deltaproteobacteria bacterium]|nr:TetR family transcriptional regulator C-terminal domain-containing protein [Deltaproteobacteria bacterium]
MPKIVDHEDRRTQIANAAARIMASRGLGNTTVRDIAKEAGFTSGILAHYFRDKNEVLSHALQLLDDRSADRFRPALSSNDPIQSVFEEGMPLDDDREVDSRVRIQFWARALSSSDLAEQQASSFKGWIRATRALLRARQKRGELDPDLKVDPISELLVALIIGANVVAVFLPKRSRRAFVRRIVDTAMEALL